MTYKFIVELLFAKYQLHIFGVILFFAWQQFKTNKKIEVQIAKCEGRFILQDYKLGDIQTDLNNHKEETKKDYVNLFTKMS